MQLTLYISISIAVIVLCEVSLEKLSKCLVVGQQILVRADLRYLSTSHDNNRVNTWQPVNSMCHQHSCLITHINIAHWYNCCWQYWHTVRYMGPLHSTWQAFSRRRRMLLDVSTCDLLLNRNWLFHSAVARRLAVGRFRCQVPQAGMHYRTVWEIQSWL